MKPVRKVVMVPSLSTAHVCVLGFALSALSASSSFGANADHGLPAQTKADVPIRKVAGRCADFGADFVDLGNGVCGRIGNHIRVQMGTRTATTYSWTGGGTSSAALRSDGAGMLPGARQFQHLRVRNGLESYSPFQ